MAKGWALSIGNLPRGGLPRNSGDRIIDRPDMTSAVDRGRKALTQLNSAVEHAVCALTWLTTLKTGFLIFHTKPLFCDMSRVVRKPVFGISDQVLHKSGCTPTGGWFENLDLGSRGIELYGKNMCMCKKQVFSRHCSYKV